MADRQLRLGAFMRPVGIHTGWWRYPGAYPNANFNFQHLGFRSDPRTRALDAFFMADHLAVLNMPIKALRRSATVTSFEPFTLLSALAGATERIELIATGSTTFDEPYGQKQWLALSPSSSPSQPRSRKTIWRTMLSSPFSQALQSMP